MRRRKGWKTKLLLKREYDEVLSRLLDIYKGSKKEVSDLNLIRPFEVSVFVDVNILTKKVTGLRYVAAEDMYEILVSGHITTGHGGQEAEALGSQILQYHCWPDKLFSEFL